MQEVNAGGKGKGGRAFHRPNFWVERGGEWGLIAAEETELLEDNLDEAHWVAKDINAPSEPRRTSVELPKVWHLVEILHIPPRRHQVHSFLGRADPRTFFIHLCLHKLCHACHMLPTYSYFILCSVSHCLTFDHTLPKNI